MAGFNDKMTISTIVELDFSEVRSKLAFGETTGYRFSSRQSTAELQYNSTVTPETKSVQEESFPQTAEFSYYNNSYYLAVTVDHVLLIFAYLRIFVHCLTNSEISSE